MRLKIEIEMEEASFDLEFSTPCPLLSARGGGLIAPRIPPGHFLCQVLGI